MVNANRPLPANAPCRQPAGQQQQQQHPAQLHQMSLHDHVSTRRPEAAYAQTQAGWSVAEVLSFRLQQAFEEPTIGVNTTEELELAASKGVE